MKSNLNAEDATELDVCFHNAPSSLPGAAPQHAPGIDQKTALLP